MKTKLCIAVITLSLLAVPAASQNETQQEPEVSPGMIGSGSMLYGLETAYDNTAMRIGLKKAGDVAQERAAEAEQAVNNNDTKGMERAARELERVANRSGEDDEEGISRAIKKMEETITKAPNSEARQGMQTALENMKTAQQNRQEARDRQQDRAGPENRDGRNQTPRENRERGNQTQQDRPDSEQENTTESGQQEDQKPENSSETRP